MLQTRAGYRANETDEEHIGWTGGGGRAPQGWPAGGRSGVTQGTRHRSFSSASTASRWGRLPATIRAKLRRNGCSKYSGRQTASKRQQQTLVGREKGSVSPNLNEISGARPRRGTLSFRRRQLLTAALHVSCSIYILMQRYVNRRIGSASSHSGRPGKQPERRANS